MEEVPVLIDRFIRGHPREAARVLENCSLDELVSFFARTPPDLAAPLLETMEASAAAGCLERMEAGRAAEALARVRAQAEHALHYTFVVERDQSLAGVLSLRELMAGRAQAPVSALMRRDVVCLGMDDSLASVRVHPGWLDFHVLPVLDEQGLFAGALRHKTLRRQAGRADEARPAQVGTALGELYRIGLTALVRSAIETEGRGSSPAATDRPWEHG